MNKRLNKLFHTLEQAKQQMLAYTNDYSEEQVSFKPAVDEWSMAQVVKHLLLTETQILQYVQKRIAKGGLHPADMKSWIRYMTVKIALRYRKKIKAPKQVAMPPEELQFAQVQEDWNQLRWQWKNTLEHLPPDMVNKNIFRHPLVGDMSIGHTLGFMTEHIRHHMAQLKRIRSSQKWR